MPLLLSTRRIIFRYLNRVGDIAIANEMADEERSNENSGKKRRGRKRDREGGEERNSKKDKE